MKHKVMDTIQRYGMVEKGGRVLAGVSGGADSVALLHLLVYSRQVLGVEVTALHLNHSLRGEESERDEEFVRQLCCALRIPLAVERLEPGRLEQQGGSLEEAARRARYNFFARHAVEPGDRVATAHTLTDNVETVLLNLVRGTGLRGLCGIPPVREHIIRPLIACSREEVEAYCAANHLDFVTDSTNFCEDMSRNRLRHRVVPELTRLNPALESAVQGMTELLAADNAYLEKQAADAADRVRTDRGILCRKLLELPAPVRRRILIGLLKDREIPYSKSCLERLEQAAAQGGEVQLSARWTCRCRQGLLTLEEEKEIQPFFEERIDLGEILPGQKREIRLPFGKSVYLIRTEYEIFEESNKDLQKALKNTLDYDRMNKIVSIRQGTQRDRLRPVGRGCRKTLKNLFWERQMSPARRSKTPVLSQEDGLLWVEGIGVDESAAARPGQTRQVLQIEILESSCAGPPGPAAGAD